MGGVRTRPGMRVAEAIEGREYVPVRELPSLVTYARVAGVPETEAAIPVVSVPPQQFIVPWPAIDTDLFRIEFGQTLPSGTTFHVRMRLTPNAPDGTVQRLWWWERQPAAQDRADVGRWRTRAGHDQARSAEADRLHLAGDEWQTFRHVLVEDSDAIAIRARTWRADDARSSPGVGDSQAGRFSVEIDRWSGTRQATPGAGARPAARLLNATYHESTPLLLALHGAQATLLQGREPERLTLNPYGFERTTGFSNEDVLSMQAVRTPSGVYLHSPGTGEGFFEGQWPPRRFFVDRVIDPQTGRGGAARIETLAVDYEYTIPRGRGRIIAIDAAYPPAALYAWQGRLIVAGTGVAPNTVWFSETDNPLNFVPPHITQTRPLLATDAFTVTEVGRPINRIVAIYGGRALVFFGTHGISFMDGAAISATSFGFRENSERGIKPGVPPVEIGTNRLVFVDASGQSVWLMTYANERQGYILSELSQVAPHLLANPQDAAFVTDLPDGGTAVLVTNEDGTLACCAVQPEGEWHAWSQWNSGDGDILDIEGYADGLWALTRRGNVGKALYIERFDDSLELDFCHVSPDGTHPFAASYPTWAAVAEMRDGSRVRFGMTPDSTEGPQRERRLFSATEVFTGIANLAADPVPDDGDRSFDLGDVVRWQVGQPFEWLVETMPFVKRTGEGSIWQSPTKTQELFVNCIERVGDDFVLGEDDIGQNVAYTVNGEFLPDTPRLFAQGAGESVFAKGYAPRRYRHINIFGWRTENAITLKGQRPCILTSLSRTVVA